MPLDDRQSTTYSFSGFGRYSKSDISAFYMIGWSTTRALLLLFYVPCSYSRHGQQITRILDIENPAIVQKPS